MFNKKEKKGQAAMEYLMTYGWAILVVLIALGALYFLGVFSPKIPSTCNAVSPITCTDVVAKSATNPTITLVLGSTNVQTATASTITEITPTLTCGTPSPTDIKGTPKSIVYTCTGTLGKGDRISGKAQVTYRLQGSTADHTVLVDFSGQAE